MVDQGENFFVCWATRQRISFSEEVIRASFLNRMYQHSRSIILFKAKKNVNNVVCLTSIGW